MKIIAGKFKGRNLDYRERKSLRVTSQKVKEAIFGMIHAKVEGSVVLDLFCGYGTLGIEAISRGAKHVTFVDVDGQALKQLNFFLDKLEIKDQTEILKRDCMKAIKHLKENTFDIVLMDPPYSGHYEIKVLEAICKSGLLKPNALCVVEHSSDNELPGKINELEKIKTRVYGDTAVSIYSKFDSKTDIKDVEVSEDDEEPEKK